ADLRDRLAAGVQIAAFAERDEFLHHRAKLLRLRQRRGDLLMLDQRGAHIAEHRLAMLRRAVELAVNLAVTHRISPSLLCVATVRRTLRSGGLPAFARKSCPAIRPGMTNDWLVMILEALGQFLDVLGRPAGH